VRLSPLGTSGTIWPTVPAPDNDDTDDDVCWALCGMKIGTGNRITQRKPTPVPLCTQQIAHDVTWARTRAAAVGNQQLTAWAMARPIGCIYLFLMVLTVKAYVAINRIYPLIFLAEM
jgi:hypothetical protein